MNRVDCKEIILSEDYSILVSRYTNNYILVSRGSGHKCPNEAKRQLLRFVSIPKHHIGDDGYSYSRRFSNNNLFEFGVLFARKTSFSKTPDIFFTLDELKDSYIKLKDCEVDFRGIGLDFFPKITTNLNYILSDNLIKEIPIDFKQEGVVWLMNNQISVIPENINFKNHVFLDSNNISKIHDNLINKDGDNIIHALRNPIEKVCGHLVLLVEGISEDEPRIMIDPSCLVKVKENSDFKDLLKMNEEFN